MTREVAIKVLEEAIKVLEPFKACMFDQHGCPISDATIALDMAIEALQEQKTGKWVYNIHDIPICDRCGYMTREYGNYCPNCGARMECEEE